LRVLENRELRRILRPKREQIPGRWRRLHNEELRNLYGLPDIIRVIKYGKMRWAGNVARIGEMRNVYKILVSKPEGKRPSDDLGVDRKILEWILGK
jgi:hypothetical protein